MIGLFFEVTPREGHAPRYFELAAALRPELDRSGGVLFIDRYTSLERPGLILSHQWWADEDSLIRWRAHTQHRAIQRAGREQHFRDKVFTLLKEPAHFIHGGHQTLLKNGLGAKACVQRELHVLSHGGHFAVDDAGVNRL